MLVCEPRFDLSREPDHVLATCGVDFRGLRNRGIHLNEWRKFEENVIRAGQDLVDSGSVQNSELGAVLPAALRGDLRALDATLPARDGEDPLAHAIQMACLIRRGQAEMELG